MDDLVHNPTAMRLLAFLVISLVLAVAAVVHRHFNTPGL